MQVDPQLLFQRLIAFNSSNDMVRYFTFELCTFAAALYKYSDMLSVPQKSLLADALWSMVISETSLLDLPAGDVQHVLDGGALLHHIP